MSYGVDSYSVLGTSIEDIFLGLMHENDQREPEKEPISTHPEDSVAELPLLTQPTNLSNGRPRSAFSQALTVFHKRWMIFRRSWIVPVLAVVIPIVACILPLSFLSGISNACVAPQRLAFQTLPLINILSLMSKHLPFLTSPPGIISSLGSIFTDTVAQDVANNATFVDTVDRTFLSQPLGGVSVDLQSHSALFAWEATPPGLSGQLMLNLASNILYNNALNVSGKAGPEPGIIAASYTNFFGFAGGTLANLKWVAFFGAAMVSFMRS